MKKILDACCGSRMFWFDKKNPDTLFMDCRSRFRVLYNRYPKLYCMAMGYTNNGYTLRHALRRMGVALPDEQRELF